MFNYVLIAVGLVVVAISFFVSEKADEKLGAKEAPAAQPKDIWTEKDEKKVSDWIEAILSEKSEEVVVRADDELSQISNEKIMAVSEFSDQLLEKLEQNHSEIIFLYNMLGEKEEEIKKLVNKPVQIADAPVSVAVQPKTEEMEVPEEAETAEKAEPENNGGSAPTLKEAISGLEAAAMAASSRKKPAPKKKTVNRVETLEGNQNEKILQLAEAGKSVLEISKELGLGQGEVKLVIDLFQGVGR